MSDVFRPERLPTPGLTYAGEVRRETPILDLQPIGPWHARVRITPLVGIRDRAQFEVSVQWEQGPPLLAFQEHWIDGAHPRHAASDVYVTDELALAREVALRCAEQLRAGARFDLQTLARETRDRRNQ